MASPAEVKALALDETVMIENMLTEYKDARTNGNVQEQERIESELQAIFDRQIETMSKLSEMEASDADRIVTKMEAQHQEYLVMTLPDGTELGGIPNASVEFELNDITEHNEAYMQVDDDKVSVQSSSDDKLSDFSWSVLFTLILGLCFSVFWSVFVDK